MATRARRPAGGPILTAALALIITSLVVTGIAGVAVHHRKAATIAASKPSGSSPTPGPASPTTSTSQASPATSTTPKATSNTTSPPTTTAEALPPVAPLSWKDCDGFDGPTGYQCATLQVPLDYSNPRGRKISLALDRSPATGSKIGSLLENPGGPGASGVDELDYIVSLLPASVLARFDIVGFDPRGVARSSPVRCLSGPQLDQYIHNNPAPTNNAGFQTLAVAAQTFAQHCEAMSGPILPFVGTVNAARDMDEIRAAVGDPKLSYIGFSYGTFLGATYADLFPTHIRAMVLDGALDPALNGIDTTIQQAAGFDRELNAFFVYCASNSLCPWQPGTNLQAAFDAIMARIAAAPLPAAPGRSLGPGEAFIGVAQELYDQAAWPGLATGLAEAAAGNGSDLLMFADDYSQRGANGVYSNAFESNNAISCVDTPWPHDLGAFQQAAATAKQRAPEFGAADLLGSLPCAYWPTPPTSQPHKITAAASPPIVVVGSTGDPATPYSDAQGLAGELAHGVLLTRIGDGHTGYRSSGCIRSYVDAYLLNLTVPRAGISCPSP